MTDRGRKVLLVHHLELIGLDHVAVGSDVFDSFTKLSWETTTKRWYPSGFLWETMAAEGRGYSDEDITKILGGNWLRLFKEVWAA